MASAPTTDPNAPAARFTLFVSSPGDVAHERRIARETFARLNAEFEGRIVLDPYFWEYEPFDFSKSFQEQIPNTANFDAVLCLLWSRLGSRLGSKQTLPDGSVAHSGTEFEITHALAAQKEHHGLPELHVWINKTIPSFQPEPADVHDERIAQWRALKQFIETWTRDSSDGSFVGSFTDYVTIADFQDKFEVKLRKIAERRAAVSPGTLAPPPKPAWTDGSPFRGLEPFDFRHAPIFFGRTAAVSGAIEALRKTQADKDDPRSFLLVLGASGSGKSSLARAGILPVLTEPGVIDGVGLWRRAVMKPSDAGGDLLLGLATAILAENALPELTSHGITPTSLATNATRIPEEIRSGLLVASEREKARQQAELDALIRQYESENRPDDVAALRLRREASQPPAARFVLLIDQFEELFTPGLPAEKRDALLAALDALARHNPIIVVLTMRSDFFPRLAEFPSLRALAEGTGSYLLAPPEPVEFGQIIRRPAQAAGLRFDLHPVTKQALDEALRDAASNDPQVLPLLEFALDELYTRQHARRDGVLRWDDYLAFHELDGVIAAKADQCVAGLKSGGAPAVGEVLSALVGFRTEPGAAAVPIRRRATPDEVEPTPGARELAAAMIAARLLVAETDASGRQTISVAHEALLTRWPAAKRWFEENLEFLKQRDRVEVAGALWEKESRNAAYLLPPGKPLDDALWLRRQPGKTLAREITEFIDASERQATAAARLRKRTRLFAGTAAALLVALALVGGMIAFQQQQQAAAQRRQAEAYFQVHQAELYLADGDFRKALTLLDGAFSAQPDFTTRSAFLSALKKAPKQLEGSFTGFQGGVQKLQFGPDGMLAAAAGGSLRLLDPQRPDAVGPAFVPTDRDAPNLLDIARGEDGSWRAQRSDGTSITVRASGDAAPPAGSRTELGLAAFSRDGQRLAGVNGTQPSELAIGSRIDPGATRRVETFAEEVTALAFAPDGSLAVATGKGAIFLLPVTGEKQPLRAAGPAKVKCLAWRVKGEPLLAAADADGNVAIFKNGTAHAPATVPEGVLDLAWSPDGQTLAAGCADGTVRTWTVPETLDAPTPLDVIAWHKGAVLSVAWSADGTHLASGGNDNTVCLWQFATALGPMSVVDKGTPLHSFAVSPDGKRLATGSEQGDIFTWEPGSDDRGSVWPTGSRVLCLEWQKDRLASGNEAGDLQIWQPGTATPIHSTKPGASGKADDQTIWRVRWSPDGKSLASSSHTGAVQIWEPDGTAPPRRVGAMPNYAQGLAWSPDGATLAAGSTGGEIWLWKAVGGAEPLLKIPRQPGEGHGDSVSSLAYLPGGKRLASCGRDGTLRLWDAQSGRALARSLPVGGSLDDLAFAADGAKIAAAGADGSLRIWETDRLVPSLAVPMHSALVSALAWNGNRVFSASEDGKVCILDLDETKWKSRARQIIGVAVFQPPAGKAP